MNPRIPDKKIEAERKAVLDLARQFARDILLAEGFYTRAAVAVAQQFLEADAEREDLRAQIKQAQLPPIEPQGETPRTDEIAAITAKPPFVGRTAGQIKWVEFARQLERELAEARAEIAEAANTLHDKLHTGGHGGETLRSIVNRAVLSAPSAKTPPLDPTPAMVEAGAQRLVRWETGKEKWPDAWSKLDVRAARNDAERCWRSMWLEAAAAAQPTEEDALKSHKRLVYNKTTRRIDVVRSHDGLVVDSFEPPMECDSLPGPEGKQDG